MITGGSFTTNIVLIFVDYLTTSQQLLPPVLYVSRLCWTWTDMRMQKRQQMPALLSRLGIAEDAGGKSSGRSCFSVSLFFPFRSSQLQQKGIFRFFGVWQSNFLASTFDPYACLAGGNQENFCKRWGSLPVAGEITRLLRQILRFSFFTNRKKVGAAAASPSTKARTTSQVKKAKSVNMRKPIVSPDTPKKARTIIPSKYRVKEGWTSKVFFRCSELMWEGRFFCFFGRATGPDFSRNSALCSTLDPYSRSALMSSCWSQPVSSHFNPSQNITCDHHRSPVLSVDLDHRVIQTSCSNFRECSFQVVHCAVDIPVIFQLTLVRRSISWFTLISTELSWKWFDVIYINHHKSISDDLNDKYVPVDVASIEWSKGTSCEANNQHLSRVRRKAREAMALRRLCGIQWARAQRETRAIWDGGFCNP